MADANELEGAGEDEPPRRLRVVYLDHVARLSGGEIALERLLLVLGRTIDAHVLLGEDGPLVPRLRALGVAVEVLEMAERTRDVRKDTVRLSALGTAAILSTGRYTWRLAARLRQIRPDLVHTNSLKSALYGGLAARLARVPVVWHIRDRIADDYLPRHAVRAVRMAARILPSAVIANSHTTMDTLPRVRRFAVVPDSVSTNQVLEPRADHKGGDGACRIGLIGRFASWKGQHVFVDAFARAFPTGDVQAWLIGDAMFGEDEYAAQIHRQVERLGLGSRVLFRGFREDIWEELSALQILVHSSTIPEPFGQVVIEGMVAGVPVIASDAGGPAETITDGVDGILVPPGDVRALAMAMQRLASDRELRNALAQAGRRTGAKYRPERTASEVLAVYERVTMRRP